MISGTGFVVSAKVMKDNEGWPYYLLTEDIQFSVVSTINQLKIGYCDTAILYDEPTIYLETILETTYALGKGILPD